MQWGKKKPISLLIIFQIECHEESAIEMKGGVVQDGSENVFRQEGELELRMCRFLLGSSRMERIKDKYV